MSSLIVITSFHSPQSSPFQPVKQTRQENWCEYYRECHKIKDLGILTFVIGTLMHVDIYMRSLQDTEPWIYICLTF